MCALPPSHSPDPAIQKAPSNVVLILHCCGAGHSPPRKCHCVTTGVVSGTRQGGGQPRTLSQTLSQPHGSQHWPLTGGPAPPDPAQFIRPFWPRWQLNGQVAIGSLVTYTLEEAPLSTVPGLSPTIHLRFPNQTWGRNTWAEGAGYVQSLPTGTESQGLVPTQPEVLAPPGDHRLWGMAPPRAATIHLR